MTQHTRPTKDPVKKGSKPRVVPVKRNSDKNAAILETIDGVQIHVRLTVNDENVLVSGPSDSVLIPLDSLMTTIDEGGSARDSMVFGLGPDVYLREEEKVGQEDHEGGA